MPSKKELIGNELIKEIVSIRIDTLWNMLALKASTRLPPVDAEKATGDFDDKGALFVPGGLIFQDWEGNPIVRKPYRERTPDAFRRAIRNAMQYDGATLLYQNGIAPRVKLSNTAYAKIASSILENKREALRRSPALGDRRPSNIKSEEIARSYCPTYIPAPYGTRTSLSTDISACLTEPRMYFREGEEYFSLRGAESDAFWEGIKEARQPIIGDDDAVLAQPYMVTCHNTRYREEILTGVTRISGFGKFGEFAAITLENATTELLHETDSKSQFGPDEIVAEHEGTQIAAVLRVYPRTNPGARLMKGVTSSLIQPEKELGLDLAKITAEAKKRYGVT